MAWGPLLGASSSIQPNSINLIASAYRPVSSREDTIWVKTDKPVPEWFISPTKPIAPKQWTVWVKSTESGMASIDLLHRNHIILNVSEVKIYNGSGWENCEADIYQTGSWKNISSAWSGELYISGDEFTSVTGGWTARGLPSYPGYGAGTPSLQKEESRMVFSTASGGSVLYASNPISFSGFSRLIFNGKFNNSDPNWQVFRVWSSLGSNAEENIVRQAKGANAESLSIDISGLSGSYVVGISSYTGSLTVDRIYME